MIAFLLTQIAKIKAALTTQSDQIASLNYYKIQKKTYPSLTTSASGNAILDLYTGDVAVLSAVVRNDTTSVCIPYRNSVTNNWGVHIITDNESNTVKGNETFTGIEVYYTNLS